jgi:tetratricopeptide (TPR) repeat protein
VSAERAWIGPALAELLSRALAAGGAVRVVPQDQVLEALGDLTVGSEPRGEQLARLGRRLGVDHALSGVYTVDAGGLVRLQLRLATTRDDRTLDSPTRSGAEVALAEVALHAAPTLRTALDAPALSAADQAAVTALLPTSLSAASETFGGLAALRAGDPGTARTLLADAARREPGHALPHAVLAAACGELRDLACAAAEATLALARMRGWSDTERRALEALRNRATGKWAEAFDRQQELIGRQPAALEPVLGLVDLQLAAGQSRGALATIEAARKRNRPWAADPRLDLAAAQTHHRLGEAKQARDAAAAAAKEARLLGAALILARARYLEGIALHDLGDDAGALRALGDARATFEARQRPLELAAALELMGIAQWGQGDLTTSQRLLENARDTYSAAGDRLGAARASMNASTVLSERGEEQSAARLAAQALTTFRELGARREEGTARLELGARHHYSGDLTAAESEYRAALQLFSRLGDKRQQAVAFTNLGEVLFMRGQLTESQQLHEEARLLNVENSDFTGIAYDTFRLAEVLAARGDLRVAATKYAEALKMQNDRGERLAAAETRLGLARLALARGDARTAADGASEAEEFARAEGAGRLQGLAFVTLAEARLAQGKVAEARQAASRARQLAGEAGMSEGILAAKRVEARLLATDAASVDRALAMLAVSRQQAEKAGLLLVAYENRLAAAEVALGAGRTAQGRELLEELAQEASRRGLGGIASRAREAAARPPVVRPS